MKRKLQIVHVMVLRNIAMRVNKLFLKQFDIINYHEVCQR